MANLAITGHATRGKEVIEILEMLGGNNRYAHVADSDCFAFYISDETGNIYYDWVHSCYEDEDTLVFSLEEFLEKFPYKVGDKVNSKYLINYEVSKMEWGILNNRVIYKLEGMGWHDAKDLQPYKEETMEDNKVIGCRIDFSLTKKVELDLGDTHEVIVEDGKTYVVRKKPQYPKTYEDCCKVLNIIPNNKLVFSNPSEESEYAYRNLALYNDLDKLKVCRDAYWKIAGDWNPDVMYCDLYCIGYDGNVVTWKMQGGCRLLVFPTAEMRDAFYENFKNLIEECKELL